MASARNYAALLIALTIAATLFTPIADTVSSNTGLQAAGNESVTAETGTYVALEHPNIDKNSETVWNATGAEMTKGTDYEMDYEDGEIKALSGGSIADGSEITVNYDYYATTGSTTTILRLVPLFVALLILGVMASKVMEAM